MKLLYMLNIKKDFLNLYNIIILLIIHILNFNYISIILVDYYY